MANLIHQHQQPPVQAPSSLRARPIALPGQPGHYDADVPPDAPPPNAPGRKGVKHRPNLQPSYEPPPVQRPSSRQREDPSHRPDPFYGQEQIARLCGRFIIHLFACSEFPPSPQMAQIRLHHFIAYALHRTKLHPSVTFAALVLLQRLKARFPTAKGSSGHRLFISAFMIASKVICDDTYSNKSWSIVAQGMFSLREVNQMEREMCNYLDWELTVDNPILSNFEALVKRDFSGDGPYPTYGLAMVSKRAARAAQSGGTSTPLPEPNVSTSPIPMFSHSRHPTPSRSSTDSPSSLSSRSSGSIRRGTYPMDASQQSTGSGVSGVGVVPRNTSPISPDTPSPLYSNTTSPASSASPATPMSVDDPNPKVHIHGFESPHLSMAPTVAHQHPYKNRLFAFAQPTMW